MRARLRRAFWLILAALAVWGAYRVEQYLPPAQTDAAEQLRSHLGEQLCSEREAWLAFESEHLRVEGGFRTLLKYEGRAPREICFSLHREMHVDEVLVDGVAFDEAADWTESFVATSRDHRRYVLPEKVEAAPAADAQGLAKVEIRFRGSAPALVDDSVRNPLAPLPLLLQADCQYVPRLSSAPAPISLRVSVPETWDLVSDAAFALGDAGPEGDNRYAVDSWTGGEQRVLPSLVLGPFEIRRQQAVGRELVVAVPDTPSESLTLSEEDLAGALQEVDRLLPGAFPDQTTLVVSPFGDWGLPLAAAPDLWIAPLPRERYGLVRFLASVALAAITPDDPEAQRSIRGVAEVVALRSIPSQQSDLRRRVRSRFRKELGHDTRLEGWLALELLDDPALVQDELSAWTERLLAGDEDAWPMLRDRGARRVYSWASRSPGVDVRFDSVEILPRDQQFELVVNVTVDPAPPGMIPSPGVDLLLVWESSAHRVRCDFTGGKANVRRKVVERPVRLVIDPDHVFPDCRLENNVYLPRGGEPLSFAVAPDSSKLAISVAELDRTIGRGVLSLYDLVGDVPASFRDWYEISGTVEDIRWITPERYLYLTLNSDRSQDRCILDLSDGRIRPFENHAVPALGSTTLLLNQERASGRYRHALYRLSTRREVAFANEYPGPLRWVKGAEEVVVSGRGGRAIVIDLAGNVRTNLPSSAAEVRDVRRSELGYTFVTESARGSELHLVPSDGRSAVQRLLSASGRIRDYFFSADSGYFYAFVEVSRNSHLVYGSRPDEDPKLLYFGPHRPLSHLHSSKGAVLVEDSSVTGDPSAAKRLRFIPYPVDRETWDAEDTVTTILCEAAFLAPPPQLSSAGRYLYYVRPETGPENVMTAHRRRALYRYDFLTLREEKLYPST